MIIKVLSLLQPWASLAVMGIKKIETRSWSTQHRGRLLIHASKGKAGAAIAAQAAISKHISDFKALPFGAIIGEVMLKDVVRVEELDMATAVLDELTLEEKAFGDYIGKYAWIFEDAVRYDEPIAATGKMGLWGF